MNQTVLKPFGVLIAAVGMAGGASAATEVQGVVAEIAVDKAYGNFAFVRFDRAPSTSIACSTNSYWHFTLPLSTEAEKRMFAVLVTARAMGSATKAIGSGACSEFGSIESMQRIGM